MERKWEEREGERKPGIHYGKPLCQTSQVIHVMESSLQPFTLGMILHSIDEETDLRKTEQVAHSDEVALPQKRSLSEEGTFMT